MERKEKISVTKNLMETKALAREWLESLGGRIPKSGATVVGLSGDLGSGKTSFTQGVAEALGVTEHVTSPTFILERIYKIDPLQNSVKIENCKIEKLIHIDAYRLDSIDETKHLGLSALMSDPANLILIEWPERIAEALPTDMLTLNFEFIDETTREIRWQ